MPPPASRAPLRDALRSAGRSPPRTSGTLPRMPRAARRRAWAPIACTVMAFTFMAHIVMAHSYGAARRRAWVPRRRGTSRAVPPSTAPPPRPARRIRARGHPLVMAYTSYGL